MNANSHSEEVWQLLHQAGSLLRDGGFTEPVPPLPVAAEGSRRAGTGTPAVGYDDLLAQYGEHLAFGSTWPQGGGTSTPLALLLCASPLTAEALAFVRSWFENPRVNLVVADHFFIQPLPEFSGEKPPYQALARDLCTLFQPKALFSLGALPAQRLLGAPLSLETLRGSDYRFDRWTMVTTSDPETFGTLPEEAKNPFKAQVWKDLQRLLGKLRYG